MNRSTARTLRFALVVAVLAGSFLLISAEKPTWTSRDKAYYADPETISYVRPGLVVEILSAEIATDGTITATVKFTDPIGVPLDLDGIETPGVIDARLIAATIPAGQKQYVAYTTRTRENDVLGTMVTQATSDSGGTWEKTGPGEYLYTFATKAPSDIDRSATHTIGVYCRRDLEEFDLGQPSDDAVFTFVPDGSEVTVVRDVVRTETCNKCHDRLTLHGRRHSVELCNLCHTPQSMDDESPNTVDMKVMIHKIHAGAELPNAETDPYMVAGNDYSNVEFPANILRCVACHDPDSGAVQADAWLTNPNRATCGSCHENVNFATGEGHGAGGPQISDNQCAQCHIPEGELPFDLSIIGAHTIERESDLLPGVVVDLLEVSGMAGESPTVTFQVTDKTGNPLIASEMNRLRLRLLGPNSDYPREADYEDARDAQGGTNGIYMYTFEEAIPADATGSWSVGVEARNEVTLLPGTTDEREDVRDLAFNDVIYFSVDGSDVEPRRTVVSLDKCNACHANLGLHGGNRNNTQYCVFCHNPNTIGEGETADDEESIDFRMMVHRIHAGAELERDYFVGGNDYSQVVFPGVLQNCDTCHVNDSQQLPLSRDLLAVMDPQGWLNPVGPASAACLACHDGIEAASHALVNTSILGESCSACHGPDRQFSVDRIHAQ